MIVGRIQLQPMSPQVAELLAYGTDDLLFFAREFGETFVDASQQTVDFIPITAQRLIHRVNRMSQTIPDLPGQHIDLLGPMVLAKFGMQLRYDQTILQRPHQYRPHLFNQLPNSGTLLVNGRS